jgi:hypothetical protein
VNTKVFDIFEEERFTAREAEEMKGQGIKQSNNGYDGSHCFKCAP